MMTAQAPAEKPLAELTAAELLQQLSEFLKSIDDKEHFAERDSYRMSQVFKERQRPEMEQVVDLFCHEIQKRLSQREETAGFVGRMFAKASLVLSKSPVEKIVRSIPDLLKAQAELAKKMERLSANVMKEDFVYIRSTGETAQATLDKTISGIQLAMHGEASVSGLVVQSSKALRQFKDFISFYNMSYSSRAAGLRMMALGSGAGFHAEA